MQEEREKYSPAIVRMCFRFTIFAKTSANSGQGNQIEYAEYKQGDAEHEQGQAKAQARTSQSTSKDKPKHEQGNTEQYSDRHRQTTPTQKGRIPEPNAARGFEH